MTTLAGRTSLKRALLLAVVTKMLRKIKGPKARALEVLAWRGLRRSELMRLTRNWST